MPANSAFSTRAGSKTQCCLQRLVDDNAMYDMSVTTGSPTTVLVVEDDASLRMLCRVNLELEGYRVLEAETHRRAARARRRGAGRRRPARPARGRAPRHGAACRFSARERPRQRVCLLSGTSEADPPDEEGVDGFIRKPFELEELTETVRAPRLPAGAALEQYRLRYSGDACRFPAMTASPRFAARRSTRTASARTSSSAPRRFGPSASGRRRSPSAPRSSPATRISSAASSSTRCARPRSRPTATSASASTGSARNARRASPTSELAERKDELENAILAERVTFKGEEMPLRTAQAKLAVLPEYRDREELGDLQGDASAAFNDDAARAPAGRRRARRRALRNRRSGRAKRRGEGHLAARARRALRQASEDSAGAFATLRDRWFEALLGDERERDADLVPHVVHAPALAARVDVHEGALGRGLPGDALPARLRPRERDEHQARPRRPAAEVAARLRDRVRPAERRPPDHPGAGRAPRLPGVPARGGSRAALRRRRPASSRTRSATSRATTR